MRTITSDSELIFATSLGLTVRLLVNVGTHGNVRLGSSLVGIWEGIVLHHFINKSPASFDPYFAYGIRLLVDFLYTQSLSRMMIVLLWTGLSIVASDITIGARRRRRDRVKSVPVPPIDPPVDPRVRFHTKKPLVPPPSSPNGSADSHSAIPPKQSPQRPPPLDPPEHPVEWPETSTDSNREQPSPAWQITSGPELLPSPVSFNDDCFRGVPPIIPPDGIHDYQALPSHVRDSFRATATQSDATESESSLPNGPHDTTLLDAWDPSYVAHMSAVDEVPMHPADIFIEDENDSEVHSDSDFDLTPTTQQRVILPHPPDVIDVPIPESPSPEQPLETEHGDGDKPLPVLIRTLRTVSSPPTLPHTPVQNQAPISHIALANLPSNISLPSSSVSNSDFESVISAGKRNTLSTIADYLREQAKAQEKERSRLEKERKMAANEGRSTDVIRLDVEAEEAAEKAQKLHEKAARKYWKAYNPVTTPFTIDVHRHRLSEAMRLTKRAICDTLTKGGHQLRVVVGNAPRGRLPSLKFAMKSALQKEKISFREDRFIPGLLIIPLVSPVKT